MADETLETQLENSEDSPLGAPSPKATAQRPMQPLRSHKNSVAKPSDAMQNNLHRLKRIAERVTLMMGAYRRADYDNAEIFASTCVAILRQFPDPVIDSVTNPGSGLQTRGTFPPSPAELRAACENSQRSFYNIERAKARREQAAKPKAESTIDRSNRPTFEQLRDKHAYWLDRKSERHMPKWVRPINEIAMEYGVSAEQLAAIPDEKQRSAAKPLGAVAATIVSRETSP
jgi:hypothetical protein